MKRLVAMLLVLVLVLALAACGKETPDGQQPAGDDEGTTTTTTAGGSQQQPDGGNTLYGTMGDGVTHLGTVEHGISTYAAGCVVYRDNDKYGVKRVDGKFDSGAVYVEVEAVGEYFTVRSKQYDDPNNFDCLNSTGVIDAQGKTVLPAQYALVKKLGDRYFEAYTVTGQTEDKDNYLVRLYSGLFSLTESDDDILYTGYWEIFDSKTGMKIPDLTDTKAGYVYTNGDVLTYTKDGVKYVKNAEGKDLPAHRRLFIDGSYIPEGEDAVYDATLTKRFDFNADEYEPINFKNGYYTMRNTDYTVSEHRVVDETGKVLNTVPLKNLSSVSGLKGGLIASNEGVFTADGQKLIDGTYYSDVYCENGWFIRDMDENVYWVDTQYTVTKVCNLDEQSEASLYGNNGALTNEVDGVDQYYSVNKKAFVEGYCTAYGLAYRETADDKQELVSTFTDEVLLAGYTRYNTWVSADGDRHVYAAAQNANGDTVYDIFMVK